MAAGLLGALLCTVATADAGATTSTTLPGPAPNQAQINATQSQVSQIEATLTQEEQQTSILDDKYNTAVQNLQNAQSTLAVDRRRASSTRGLRSKSTSASSATDAVAAYVYGTPETGFASYFSTSATLNQARNQYTDQIVGNLTKDEAALRALRGAPDERRGPAAERGGAGTGRSGAGQVVGTGQRAGGRSDEANPGTGAGPTRSGGRAGRDSRGPAGGRGRGAGRQPTAAATGRGGGASGSDRRRRSRWIGQRCGGDRRPRTRRPATPARSAAPLRAARAGWPRCRLRCPSWACPTSSAASSPASASTARGWCSGPGRRRACPSPGPPRRSGPP